MEKHIFLINGHQYWEISKGELNKSLVEFAKKVLTQKGYSVKTTHVDDVYDPKEEVEKFMWADFIIFQTPVYWFSIPGRFKSYIDEVYNVFFYFHKAQQFVGMEHLPAFACYDVLKNSNMEVDFQRYEEHLNKLF